MLKMVLNFKNIVLEAVGIIFLGLGVEKLQVASNSEKYQALIANDFEKFNHLTEQSVGEFFVENTLWKMWAMIIGFSIIVLFKIFKKRKKQLWDSLLSFAIVFALILAGLLKADFTYSGINFIGSIISENLKSKSIINGLIWSTTGIGFIWFALKNTTHNKA